MNKVLKQYLITALWSSNDDAGNPLDENYSINDIDAKSVTKQEKQLNLFIQQAGELLNGLDMIAVAHNFWLTRNGYGAGFWDGDYPDTISEKLTDLADTFGTTDLYVGDDGKIYFS